LENWGRAGVAEGRECWKEFSLKPGELFIYIPAIRVRKKREQEKNGEVAYETRGRRSEQSPTVTLAPRFG
jgi:hypothetical protein